MKLYSKAPSSKKYEAGVILVLFSITIPVLLGLLALAIDSGNLYLTRARLTKVARASSATALNMMALYGWGALVADSSTNQGGLDLGLQTADLIISENGPITAASTSVVDEIFQSTLTSLKWYYPADFPDNSADYPNLRFKLNSGAITDRPNLSMLDRSNSSVRLTIRYRAKTYLLGAVSQMLGFGDMCQKDSGTSGLRCWTESVAQVGSPTGQMKQANVFMLLDVSGSMNEQVNSVKKSTKLVEAAANFIDMFNPFRDKFAVIPYATTADTGSAPTLDYLDRTSESGYFRSKKDIERLAVGGQTNQCDALIQVIRTIEDNPTLRDKKTPKFVLLFTDGAPNVYRLNFCNDGACSQTQPRLQSALSLATSNPDPNSPGWYGWTVKWDKREVFSMDAAHETCPTDGGDGRELSPGPGSNINTPPCDPVWAFPKVIDTNSGTDLDYTTVSSHLRLNQDGEFFMTGSTYGNQTLSQLGYSLKFRNWGTSPRDYQYSDAYRWHGPSYLVHSSFRIPRGVSLTERIPTTLASGTGQDAEITCGPGSRYPYPGYVSGSTDYVDTYNHSRYFASRAVDADWKYNGTSTDDSSDKAAKTKLTQNQTNTPPGYFFDTNYRISAGSTTAPGCLATLDSQVPYTTAQINVGPNFVSNPTSSIQVNGEAVKTAELPYYCALRAADWLRSQYNVVIFVVGLGPSATSIYGSSCQDPLQNALDPNSRKNYFLRRLAFAPESLSDPVAFYSSSSGSNWNSKNDFRFRTGITLNSCPNHPLSGVSIELGYSEDPYNLSGGYSPSQHGFTRDNLGAYYGSNDPTQLKLIFATIAKRMLLRLAT
jgi:hypothetical protein